MRGESGQASVEWIGFVLLLALGMATLVRFAPRADAEALGAELLHAIRCAARGGCEAPQHGRAAADPGPAGGTRRMVSAPP
jgi:hypothetical protein